jgi:AcrR family transcriptional regulator
MTRIVKEHDLRKKEIVDVAERLFITKGYDETSVEEIIHEVEIAKGTFYHYFRSKDEILSEIVERLIVEVEIAVKDLSAKDDVDPLGKIFLISNYFRTLGIGREKMTDFLHEERNVLLHHRIEQKIIPILNDILGDIVTEGVETGQFHTPYPRETAVALLGASHFLAEGHQDHVMRTAPDPDLILAACDIMERLLGLEKGTIIEYYRKMEVDQ